MIARVATHESLPSLEGEGPDRFRAWMKEQPGFVGAWHFRDSTTGRGISVSIWQDQASLEAIKTRTPPGGPVGMKPLSIEVFDDVTPF
jgi:hypothetical protein